MRRIITVAVSGALLASAGCSSTSPSGGTPRSGGVASPAPPSGGAIADGVYRYEVTEQHLTAGGVTPQQAADEHGVHTVTMIGGQYSDSWRNAAMTKTCRGTYSWQGSRLSVRWTTGCTGDWAMTVQVAGDQVRWTDVESLPPEDDAYAQALNEAFHSVPWTWVGDSEDAAES